MGGRCLLGREVYTLTIETLLCKHAIFIAYDAGAPLALAQNYTVLAECMQSEHTYTFQTGLCSITLCKWSTIILETKLSFLEQ